jgi:hypothetical protein
VSARIVLYCNRESQYGTCMAQVITDAHTIPEAREAAGRIGWRAHANGRDYCPGCSGHRAGRLGTNVLHLHSPEEPTS